MAHKTLVAALVCASAIHAQVCISAQKATTLDQVKAQFVSHAVGKLDAYQIIETVGRRAERQAALTKTMGTNVFAGTSDWDTRDIVVVDLPQTTKAHLGILRLRYADAPTRQKQLSALRALNGVFPGSEVLTHFVAVPSGDSLFVLYTETVLNERVKAFLAVATKMFTP